ncbi:MAG: hypothetical protein AABX11_03740 [Nanoarchaeota archaeon]
MNEQYASYSNQGGDSSARMRDLEEKVRLLKDRVTLTSKTLIDEREKTFKELQELKKIATRVQEENKRIKELLERVSEQLNNSPRREELAIIQRQLEMLRKG